MARFLVAPAGSEAQDVHEDKLCSVSVHLALTAASAAQGTRVWVGSHKSHAKERCVQVALKPGQLFITFANVLHGGSNNQCFRATQEVDYF